MVYYAMLKHKRYQVDASHQIINNISQISEILGLLSLNDLNGCKYRQDSSIKLSTQNLKQLFLKFGVRVSNKNVATFLEKMSNWKPTNFDDFLEAAKILSNRDELRFKRVDVPYQVAHRGFSQMAKMKNSPSDFSAIFQVLDKQDYHPLIRSSLFEWIVLKHPIFHDRKINQLMAFVWQFIMLSDWRASFYLIFRLNNLHITEVESVHRRFQSSEPDADDPSKFVQDNVNFILKMLMQYIERQETCLQNKMISTQSDHVKLTEQVVQSNKVLCTNALNDVEKPHLKSNSMQDKHDQEHEKQYIEEQKTLENIKRLVSCMEPEKTYKASELQERIGLSSRPNFSSKYLNPAIELGFILMTIPEKTRSRNQEYFLNIKKSD